MDNLRAASLMTMSMGLFAIEDAFIRALSAHLSVGQVMATIGLFGGLVFWGLLARGGDRLFTRALLHPAVLMRNLGELAGSFGFVTAIATVGLTTSSAILQALPLALVLGAALFLGESVGWRRWTAIVLGFIGVLLILRPGLAGFQVGSLFGLLSVAGLTVRDLATRRMPRHIPSHQLSASAFLLLAPAGLLIAAVSGTPLLAPRGIEWVYFVGCVGAGVAGYAAIVLATRVGEASLIAPFRYSRLVFALIFGVMIFHERPDAATLAGAALICASGVFAMWRDLIRRRA